MPTKKRLIFALLYFDGYFCQSRNFQCQKVGGFEWLFNNYQFSHIAGYLDELAIINVNPHEGSHSAFLRMVEKIVDRVFVPVAVGGGLNSVNKALDGLRSGADKIVLNSSIRTEKNIVSQIVNKLGSQSVVASVDYKVIGSLPVVFDWTSKKPIPEMGLQEYLQLCTNMGFGEILLNSVDRDGTGFGLDTQTLTHLSDFCQIPLIVMGGAGNYQHFKPAYDIAAVDAVATANLLNFIGNSIPDTREKLLEEGVNLARFGEQEFV